MTHLVYPFAAIVGQRQMKLALLLAGVDWRLSVLLKGDKGSGKSTAARSLLAILPPGAAFVNVPIGSTEDRLLGGLDLSAALQGAARLKQGLIHAAHGGVLYIDEVNLLADALTDALLDVASSGRHYMERDGLSASAESNFILLGSMNIEEGSLRPQLLDRFALSLDVEAPLDAVERAHILESRLRFDADPASFCAAWEEEQSRLRQAVSDARCRLSQIHVPGEQLELIGGLITDSGVRSLRADLATLRAALAHAALAGHAEVNEDDIQAVLPLVLGHRMKPNPHSPPPSPPPPQTPKPNEANQDAAERVFDIAPKHAPALRTAVTITPARGRSAIVSNNIAPVLDVVGSFTQSFRNTGAASLKSDQLVFKTSIPKSGTRFIFVIDASGSHAAQQRMRTVKGAVAALLESSADPKDEVAVISFRGAKAEIVLEPCRSAPAAARILEFLPTGGRTPLAHALHLAQSLVTPNSLLVLLTDGRANVPLGGSDPWTDALAAGAKITCPAVLVDSSLQNSPPNTPVTELAAVMKAKLSRLDDLDNQPVLRILRQ